MLMMRPQPRLAIKGAAPTSKKALLTLSRNARSKVPASTFGVGAAISAPSLFTSMSTPEGRDSLLDQPARRAGFLEVVGEEHRLAARADDRMDHLAAPGLATAGDCDAGARFPEPPGDLRPNPRGRAGNDSNASWFYAHSSALRLYLVNSQYALCVIPAHPPIG